MTTDEAQRELDRVTPIWQKHGEYMDALRKIISEAQNPPVKIEDLKAEADAVLVANIIKV